MLSTSIKKTLAFYDLLNIPLTAEEVFFNLYEGKENELKDIYQELGKMVAENQLGEFEGHYFLSGHSDNFVEEKKRRQARAIEWMNELGPWLTTLSAHPGVEMIAICNNLSWMQATENSDVDLFVVAKPGYIWQVRFFLTAYLHLLRKRPTPKVHAKRICLSFFASSDGLDLSELAVEDDIYLKYWLYSLLPIYDPKNLREKLYQENSDFLKDIKVPKYRNVIPQHWKVDTSSLLFKFFRTIFAQTMYIPEATERFAKRWQMRNRPEHIRVLAENDGTSVVMNDKVLKFHIDDRREEMSREWKDKIN